MKTKEVIDLINDNKFSIIMHSENSLLYSKYIEYITLFINENYGKNIVFFSPNPSELRYIKEMIEINHKVLILDSTAKKIRCINGNSIIFCKSHKNTSLGVQPHVVFLLSASYVQNSVMYMIYKSIYPIVSSLVGARMIISSVPNKKNWFHEKFIDAENGKNEYVSLRLYYWEEHDVNGTWVTDMIKAIGAETFNLIFNLSI